MLPSPLALWQGVAVFAALTVLLAQGLRQTGRTVPWPVTGAAALLVGGATALGGSMAAVHAGAGVLVVVAAASRLARVGPWLPSAVLLWLAALLTGLGELVRAVVGVHLGSEDLSVRTGWTLALVGVAAVAFGFAGRRAALGWGGGGMVALVAAWLALDRPPEVVRDVDPWGLPVLVDLDGEPLVATWPLSDPSLCPLSASTPCTEVVVARAGDRWGDALPRQRFVLLVRIGTWPRVARVGAWPFQVGSVETRLPSRLDAEALAETGTVARARDGYVQVPSDTEWTVQQVVAACLTLARDHQVACVAQE